MSGAVRPTLGALRHYGNAGQEVDRHVPDPANDIVGITAEVVGCEGGTTTVACPSGYALVAAAVGTDQRTDSGMSGWADGGGGRGVLRGERGVAIDEESFTCEAKPRQVNDLLGG